MGIRGELFSTKVLLQNRTYFFNVKENRMGDLYLNIVESKNKDTGGFERQSVILFAEDLPEFLKGFDESLRVLEKAVKEKRRASPREDRPNRKPPTDSSGDTPRRGSGDEAPRDKKRYTGKTSGAASRNAPGTSSRSAPGTGPRTASRGKPKTADRKPRKVVVRKRDRDD
ncbi:DUF3276 family protein [Treponema primitia]|uniref:DUF3276 family protein n=1 Tax=Treponema primitia TaxID=88058 RepID=UPI00025557DC|nr:DUF3276 family protein [Treponema primitia]